jgi:hypothetical protein
MKSKTARNKSQPEPVRFFGESLDFEGIRKRMAERHAKFMGMSKAKQRAELIRRGVLTPEGKLPVYPMDHVPLGPRE